MPWTEEQAEEARSRGWKLCDVHDGRRWTLMPMPVGDFPKSIPNADALMRFIVRQAQHGDALTITALKHITQVNHR